MSKYYNLDKEATVSKNEIGYIVEMFMDGKLVQKRHTFDEESAEALAEEFVLNGKAGPKFLSENA
jgi:hypothetical protein